MPTFLDQHRLAPKSALRYRPLRADVETYEGVAEPERSRGGHRVSRVSASRAKSEPALVRRTWVPVLIGMLAAVLMVWVGSLVLSWMAVALDDLHYGRPRTRPGSMPSSGTMTQKPRQAIFSRLTCMAVSRSSSGLEAMPAMPMSTLGHNYSLPAAIWCPSRCPLPIQGAAPSICWCM